MSPLTQSPNTRTNVFLKVVMPSVSMRSQTQALSKEHIHARTHTNTTTTQDYQDLQEAQKGN